MYVHSFGSLLIIRFRGKEKEILADSVVETARHKDSARALIDAIDGQLDRCKKLHTEMGVMQLNMQKTLNNFQ